MYSPVPYYFKSKASLAAEMRQKQLGIAAGNEFVASARMKQGNIRLNLRCYTELRMP